MAFDPCCSTVIGGEVYLNVTFASANAGPELVGSGAVMYQALGEVRLQPAAIERTAGAASGGQVWVTEASRPIRAVLSFVNRCYPNPMRLFCQRCDIDVTIIEKSRGIEHLLHQCIAVGAPEINFATGEVSGIELVCAGGYEVHSIEAEPYKWCQTLYDENPGSAGAIAA